MTERPVGVTDTAAGAGVAEIRTRERTVGATAVAEQYVIPVSEYVDGYVTSYRRMFTAFRTLGLASADHNLLTIFNKTGSTKLLALRRLTIQFEDTGASTALAKVAKTARITALPTGGTVLEPLTFDSALTHDLDCEVMGATAADGGAATPIAATPVGPYGRAQFKTRQATSVGQILFPDESLIPSLCESTPIILRPLEGLLVSMTDASVTTASYLINCFYEELVAAT
jgi:hypothetical protein